MPKKLTLPECARLPLMFGPLTMAEDRTVEFFYSIEAEMEKSRIGDGIIFLTSQEGDKMAMNPDTNRLEELGLPEGLRRLFDEKHGNIGQELGELQATGQLVRPDGTPVPKTWSVFAVDELVEIKGYTFRVRYIGETSILFEPVGPIVVGEGKDE